ncbi:MAG: hypothetical protein ABIK11_07955 [candidate division WOR-3 bacterium]
MLAWVGMVRSSCTPFWRQEAGEVKSGRLDDCRDADPGGRLARRGSGGWADRAKSRSAQPAGTGKGSECQQEQECPEQNQSLGVHSRSSLFIS